MSSGEGALHATAFLMGETGLLVTGASGSGKSTLVLEAAVLWRQDPVRLVADDRVFVRVSGGRLVARPHAQFLGKIECRGIGIAETPAMPSAVLRGIVTLESGHPSRIPEQNPEKKCLFGIFLPVLRLREGQDAGRAFVTRWPHFRAFL
jgi:HPr kinase/phosphorylase